MTRNILLTLGDYMSRGTIANQESFENIIQTVDYANLKIIMLTALL